MTACSFNVFAIQVFVAQKVYDQLLCSYMKSLKTTFFFTKLLHACATSNRENIIRYRTKLQTCRECVMKFPATEDTWLCCYNAIIREMPTSFQTALLQDARDFFSSEGMAAFMNKSFIASPETMFNSESMSAHKFSFVSSNNVTPHEVYEKDCKFIDLTRFVFKREYLNEESFRGIGEAPGVVHKVIDLACKVNLVYKRIESFNKCLDAIALDVLSTKDSGETLRALDVLSTKDSGETLRALDVFRLALDVLSTKDSGETLRALDVFRLALDVLSTKDSGETLRALDVLSTKDSGESLRKVCEEIKTDLLYTVKASTDKSGELPHFEKFEKYKSLLKKLHKKIHYKLNKVVGKSDKEYAPKPPSGEDDMIKNLINSPAIRKSRRSRFYSHLLQYQHASGEHKPSRPLYFKTIKSDIEITDISSSTSGEESCSDIAFSMSGEECYSELLDLTISKKPLYYGPAPGGDWRYVPTENLFYVNEGSNAEGMCESDFANSATFNGQNKVKIKKRKDHEMSHIDRLSVSSHGSVIGLPHKIVK